MLHKQVPAELIKNELRKMREEVHITVSPDERNQPPAASNYEKDYERYFVAEPSKSV
jgi:hypothetical protein